MGIRKPKLNVGKQFASGTGHTVAPVSLKNRYGNNRGDSCTITVTGLSFKPSTIKIYNQSTKALVCFIDTKNQGIDSGYETFRRCIFGYTSTDYDGVKVDGTTPGDRFWITSTGFKLGSYAGILTQPIYWEAYSE